MTGVQTCALPICANAGLGAAIPIFQEVFIGRLSAEDGIPQAQEEGNAAMAE